MELAELKDSLTKVTLTITAAKTRRDTHNRLVKHLAAAQQARAEREISRATADTTLAAAKRFLRVNMDKSKMDAYNLIDLNQELQLVREEEEKQNKYLAEQKARVQKLMTKDQREKSDQVMQDVILQLEMDAQKQINKCLAEQTGAAAEDKGTEEKSDEVMRETDEKHDKCHAEQMGATDNDQGPKGGE